MRIGILTKHEIDIGHIKRLGIDVSYIIQSMNINDIWYYSKFGKNLLVIDIPNLTYLEEHFNVYYLLPALKFETGEPEYIYNKAVYVGLTNKLGYCLKYKNVPIFYFKTGINRNLINNARKTLMYEFLKLLRDHKIEIKEHKLFIDSKETECMLVK